MFWKFFFLVNAIVFTFSNTFKAIHKQDVSALNLYIMATCIVGYIALKWGL